MEDITAMAGITKHIGVPRKRSEDPQLLMGQARYVDDIVVPGTLEVAFLRSTHAHARLTRIGVDQALAHPGCVHILTGQDFPIAALSTAPNIRGELTPVPLLFMARDKVRYVGEIIALVVAESRYLAEDIVELIEVDYEALPVSTDCEAAMTPEAARIHDEIPGNVYYHESFTTGDIDAAFRDAAVVVKERVKSGRTSAAPMETRGVLAHWDWDDTLTVWSSTQMPYPLRTHIAMILGLPEQKIRVVAPTVGGGFGQKAHFFPEEFILPWLSRQLRRPLKWTEDRREHLIGTIHAKENTMYVEVALAADGFILGMKFKSIGDSGAYAALPWTGLVEPVVGVNSLPGAYKLPALQYETMVVLTNKTPIGGYRGVGWSAAVYAREVVLSKAARVLGMDIADVYHRNFIGKHEFPFTSLTKQVYDSGDYAKVLDTLLEKSNYRALQSQAKRQANGRLHGIGVSFFVEPTNWGSQTALQSGFAATFHDTTKVEIDPSGKVTVRSGQFSHGQGLRTTLAQVAAETLGVRFEDVVVLDGDTATGAYGMGTFASRSAVIGGGTVMRAATDVRNKLLRIAAHVMEANVADLTIEDSRIFVRGSPERAMTVAEIAFITHFDRFRRPPEEEVEPTLSATRHYDPPAAYANGAHAIEIELDPDTGMIDIRRIVAVEDCGNMINPRIVEGQMRGGVSQAIGMGMLESLDYDENGQLRNASFMDFLLPNARTLPDIECHHVVTPSPVTEGGFKGAGEAAMLSVHIALANAVADALSEFGNLVPMVTPIGPQQVMDLIGQARSAA